MNPYRGGPQPWPQEKEDRYRELYDRGLSHGVISDLLGITRNASIGKAHRLNLSPRKPGWLSIPRVKLTKKELARRAAERNRLRRAFLANLKGNVEAEAPPLDATGGLWPALKDRQRVHHHRPPNDLPKPESLNLTLLELADNQCHFIAGDDYLYCGQPVWETTDWCPYHHRVVRILPSERVRGAPNPSFVSSSQYMAQR